MEADRSLIELAQASPAPAFKSIRTGGSWSVGGSWKPLRQAGATAREMLISAAANTWGVERATCRAEKGAVIHGATGRRLLYGALVEEASSLPVPTEAPLKDPSDFKIVGRRMRRFDGPRIVEGSAIYGIDARVPGMRYATIVRCPILGGKVASWDATAAKSIPGVRDVVAISTGVAVVADSNWAALTGREALKISWDEGPNRDFNSGMFWKRLEDASRLAGRVTRKDGDGLQALERATRKLEAIYKYPFQAHATLEPMNCLVDVREDHCEFWAPTQAPDRIQENVAKLLGLEPGAVKVNVTLVGGGFGRRLGWDYAIEAAEVGRAIREPVQVLWTHQDDMRHGHFQPASLHRMAAGLDHEGKPIVWAHKKAGSFLSILGPPSPQELESTAYYQDSAWGSYDIPYTFPAIETAYVAVDSPVPSGPWRSVYSPSCTFARECFFDEVSRAARKDPLQLRLELLRQPQILKVGDLTIDRSRLSKVLKLAAEKAGWGRPMPQGWGKVWRVMSMTGVPASPMWRRSR